MLTRSRLRAVLRSIAAGVPLIGASCACPKPYRETIGTYSGLALPPGPYDLRECRTPEVGGVIECRYEQRGGHAVIQLMPCEEVCPTGDACDGEGQEIVCVHEDAETSERTDLRVALPATLEHPEAYAGTCTGEGDYACTYTSARAPGRVTHLESFAGFLPEMEHDNDPYGCDVDPATSEITCWHGKYYKCSAGRRPDGAVTSTWAGDPQLVLEAASVPAFEALAGELRAHAAPRALVQAARRAMTDELRHAGLVAALAGAGPVEIRVERREPRELLAVALDNAREGCAGEALAAVAAHALASRADGTARAALASIARDEAGHALLSFAIDDWARARLGPRASRLLDDAHRDALRSAAGAVP